MLLPEFCEELFYVKKVNLFTSPFSVEDNSNFKNYLEKVLDYSFLETQSFFKELNKNYTIEQLKKLRFLDLTYNKLKTIINLNLPNLQILYLSANYLKKIPTLTLLPNLQIFSLCFNQLIEFPTLTFLPKLETLHLGYNQLTEISDLKLKFTKLKYLNLGSNQLTEKSKTYLKSLKSDLLFDN